MCEVGQAAGGYHHSTVSLALRNDPAIRASVRERIQRAARKLGYHRDPLLDAFNRRRHAVLGRRSPHTIAMVGVYASRWELEVSARERTVWSGAVAEAERLGCQVEYFPLGPGGMTAQRLDAVLYARGIGGVIFLPFSPKTPPPELTWSRYCAVKIECGHFQRPEFTIAPALLQGLGQAFEALRRRGFRRVGMAMVTDVNPLRADLVSAGFLLKQQGVPADEQIPLGVFGGRRTTRQIREWLGRHRPDAVLAEREIGGVVGEIASRIGLPCASVQIDAGELSAGGMGIVVDHARLGAVAIAQVVALMRTRERPSTRGTFTTLVPTMWRSDPEEAR
ncbi:MAG: LacI family DNA-binding transcriptional regulator [Opitutaceae bacterium]|nr:LacI family DNA-binding transcriptional regulator [Opitutaceae bacterium]